MGALMEGDDNPNVVIDLAGNRVTIGSGHPSKGASGAGGPNQRGIDQVKRELAEGKARFPADGFQRGFDQVERALDRHAEKTRKGLALVFPAHAFEEQDEDGMTMAQMLDMNDVVQALAVGDASESQQRQAAFFLTVFVGGVDWAEAKKMYKRLHGAKLLGKNEDGCR